MHIQYVTYGRRWLSLRTDSRRILPYMLCDVTSYDIALRYSKL